MRCRFPGIVARAGVACVSSAAREPQPCWRVFSCKPLRLRSTPCSIPIRRSLNASLRPLIRWAGDEPSREGLLATPARVVGISKLARLVDAYGRRLQIQERLTAEIADTLNRVLQARGVAVVIQASHECISSRGARMHGVSMVTRRLLGQFEQDPYRRDILAALSG